MTAAAAIERETFSWSPQQEIALKKVRAWLREGPGKSQVFYLAGYAGVGKTTLIRALAEEVHGKICYAAFTGKAALVMRSKGCPGASTIHSLIYKVDDEIVGVPTFRLNKDSDVADAELVVIDEVSMVGEDLGRDLLSFGTPVLVLGDPEQLPPVQGAGFFTSREPDVLLTEVHRQARDNPIIQMSMTVREGGRLKRGRYGESRVIRREEVELEDVLAADQVLVGINRTRHTYNRRIREVKEYEGFFPTYGERLVCLRNNREKGLLNGGIWSVEKILDQTVWDITMIVKPEDAGMVQIGTEVCVAKEFFTGQEKELSIEEQRQYDHMTFGYALTVHKSQGSQWDNVYLFDESFIFREDRRRHLYTGITRAAERITIVQ